MFDTVNLILFQDELHGVNLLEDIAPCLSLDFVGFHEYEGRQVMTGKTGNLKIAIDNNKLTVTDGSLCKWMMGDNFQTMGRRDTQRAIERLSDELRLPMARARVTRFDIGVTMVMREPTENYINHLGNLSRAKRYQYGGTTLYYDRYSKTEQLCFYDKCKEYTERHRAIPELYRGMNVLRYEQRYLKHPHRRFNKAEITAEMLYTESFYMSILKRFKTTYQAIEKVHELTPNFQYMRGVKEFNQLGRLALINQFGGELAMLTHMKEAQRRGELTRDEFYKLKASVIETCKTGGELTTPTTAIAELDKKIAETIKYFR